MIRDVLNDTCTIKRAPQAVTGNRLIPGAFTVVAGVDETVVCRIESAGTTPEATVLGLAAHQAYQAWILKGDSWSIYPEDELHDSSGNIYRIVSVDNLEATAMSPSSDHWHVLMEKMDT